MTLRIHRAPSFSFATASLTLIACTLQMTPPEPSALVDAAASATNPPATSTPQDASPDAPVSDGGQTPIEASSATAPGPGAAQNFAARCAAPGVVRCVGFDQDAEIAGKPGNPSGILPGTETQPLIDKTIRASGNGSLLFEMPANGGSNAAGAYFTNFSDDFSVQFDQNEEFYVQWRQRFSPEFISTKYRATDGSITYWKQTVTGTGDLPGCSTSSTLSLENYPEGRCAFSCTALEVVTVNGYMDGFVRMYNSCSGSTSHGPYDPFAESIGGGADFKLQNAMPAPYCLYSQGKTNPPSYFPPSGNCFAYVASEWMTFQQRIKLGPRVGDEFKGSYVELWVAREGQPSVKVISWGPYNLSAGPLANGWRFGKIWLMPYMTGKDPAQTTPVARTWYDELIVSKEMIADPQ